MHWAADADEANRIIVDLIKARGESEVIKVKTMTSDETRLNVALEAAGIAPYETDLADLIIQLGDDRPSHIVVPALHRNRAEIREIFLRRMQLEALGGEPEDLTAAARQFLREKFLRVPVGFSGANFLVADTGGVCVVESEGNARMCLTLPRMLITLAGIEKIVPTLQDLEVFLQLLPRSATGERMNPYNTIWTGTTAGDGPEEFHVVLLDNGRTKVLADAHARETLHCIRCAACLNACPVYRQTGGHAYGSIYSGPIGAILTPQLQDLQHSRSLPYASSLCGACYEVCPVKINIPEILIHLRARIVEESGAAGERMAMKAALAAFADPRLLKLAQTIGRFLQRPLAADGYIRRAPGPAAAWTATRDLPAIPRQSFREWWALEMNGSAARSLILGRIRDIVVASGERTSRLPRSTPASSGRTTSGASLPRDACLELFIDRLKHYQVAVHLCARGEIAATIAGTTGGARQVPPDRPGGHRSGVAVERRRLRPRRRAWRTGTWIVSEGVLTGCSLGIATTGTIVLRHGPGEGRRALTLIPDYHLCVVLADQVVETVPEAFRVLAASRSALVTTISGPSATADIEMTRIRGVHGPRTLDVIVVDAPIGP